MEPKRKTLLEKFEIPLNHLDFDYVKKCEDAREMEKIVQILRSNEEGFYPDLTQCAENKLKELKPNSKLFRIEEQIQKRDALDKDELKPIYDWNKDIKTKDSSLAQLAKAEEPFDTKLQLPPVRESGSIDKKSAERDTKPENTGNTNEKKTERIKSTDYGKWDKYDADEEVLRLELAEERELEENEIKKRIKKEEMQKTKKITELTLEEKDAQFAKNLTEFEREKFAEHFRLRGNEYFRAKEYENAILEYTRGIRLNTKATATLYNNRAINYLKLKKYVEAIADCEACLKIEPNNLKARIRHADANHQYGRRREAYDLYLKVLDIDPENSLALKGMADIRKQLGDLPPPTATRLTIEEITDDTKVEARPTAKKQVEKVAVKTPDNEEPDKEYNLAELVKPKRLVPRNVAGAMEGLQAFAAQSGKSNQQPVAAVQSEKSEFELILPTNAPKPGKKLIEEL